MLPYPTDRRRLLMMVRVFLHEFSEFVRAHEEGGPSLQPGGDTADHLLEAFLERLAIDAAQIDDATDRSDTETIIQRDLERYMRDLLHHASWNSNRLRWN